MFHLGLSDYKVLNKKMFVKLFKFLSVFKKKRSMNRLQPNFVLLYFNTLKIVLKLTKFEHFCKAIHIHSSGHLFNLIKGEAMLDVTGFGGKHKLIISVSQQPCSVSNPREFCTLPSSNGPARAGWYVLPPSSENRGNRAHLQMCSKSFAPRREDFA